MNGIIEKYKDRVEELIGRGVHIPALPAQGAELLKITNQPLDTVNSRRVTELIESEPTLTAMLLRLANSSRYGTSRSIRRVDHALFIVGLEESLSLLGFYLVRNMFPRWLNLPHFTVDGYWYHSWVCAHAAQILGQPRYLVQSLPGELYIAGLLHDIGKAVMAVHLPEESIRCIALAQRVGIPQYEAERQVLGIDHAILGGHLLNQWMLPPAILDAVCCHHDPGHADPENRELVALVQLADAVAICVQDSLEGDAARELLQGTWLYLEGRSPLVRENILWPLIEEIRTRLNVKAAETIDPDAAAMERRLEAQPVTATYAAAQPRAVRARQSLWGRFAAWCGGLFT